MTALSTMRAERPLLKLSSSGIVPVVRTFALAAILVAAPLYEAMYVSSLSNASIWGHLRSGLWILENRSIPHGGLFSQYPNLPWIDSSWAFDLALAAVYKLLGLRAIPVLSISLRVALALVTWLLVRAGKPNFWSALGISAVAQYVIPVSQGLPYAASIVLFGIELLLLEGSRRVGTTKPLYCLPPLFLVWANVHALFLAGLLLMIVFSVSGWIEDRLRRFRPDWMDREIRPLRPKPMLALSIAAFLATLINPYTFHLFPSACRTLYSDAGFQYLAELRAMSFRQPQDYALMLLVMAAFLALGRRRSLRVFELLALTGGTLLAFRIQREAWMAVLPAIAILSGPFGLSTRDWDPHRESLAPPAQPLWEKPLSAVMITALLLIAAFRLPHEEGLMLRLNQNFPIKACDFIRQHDLSRPLFNEYSWGSFLTWYLPQYPVAIDGRLELYGDEFTAGYFKVIAGGERIEAYPALASAQTLLLQKESGMTKALTTLPSLAARYRLAYSDEVAAVFVRQ